MTHHKKVTLKHNQEISYIDFLSEDKIYKVIHTSVEGKYLILNDRGLEHYYDKNLFDCVENNEDKFYRNLPILHGIEGICL